MAKRIMRLTESDLVRLVKKVVKEQYDDRDLRFNTTIRDDSGDLEHEHRDYMIMLKGKSSKQVQRVLSNLSENLGFLSLLDCESADFSNVDLCEFPNLKSINLRGTSNNFDETQGDCFEPVDKGLYFRNAD
jgi:hypothetical protein